VSDDLRLESARIAFACIRFEEPAAHPLQAYTPPGAPRIGIDAYSFTPAWERVPRAEVEAFLAALPSPALLSQTTTRGIIALTLLHELSGDRRRWAERALNNQTNGFDEITAKIGLSPESSILLEFRDESHVFSFAGVRTWTQRFGMSVGWSVTRLANDGRAQGRMLLYSSDGRASRGAEAPNRKVE
jgi:hypothetical protein